MLEDWHNCQDFALHQLSAAAAVRDGSSVTMYHRTFYGMV